MTDQQINDSIAAACGIVGKDQYGPLYQTPEGWVVDCPQFCTDLNAMAEALKTLPPDQLWDVAYSLPMETLAHIRPPVGRLWTWILKGDMLLPQ